LIKYEESALTSYSQNGGGMVINDYENGGEIKNKAEEMVANFRN
jgi:hypothetical protein